MKKIYIGIIVLLVLLGIGYLYSNKTETTFGGVADAPKDIIGTKVGTTTAGVIFQDNNATTTYPTWVGGDYDTAAYTFGIKNASTSAQGASNLHFSLLASNDANCATASTTTSYADIVLVKDVNWFDAAPFLDGHAAQSLTNGTSTIIWDTSAMVGSGRTLLLTNLNVQCLALQTSGSSTVVWSQLKLKLNN